MTQSSQGFKGVRSRTGCLTCRQRKLKCDEQKPVCGQCHKANRQCQPSTGLTFRHQHNASMNSKEDGPGAEGSPALSGFYSYKNTFDANTVWLDIPKQLTFYHTSNPYLDGETPEPDSQISMYDSSPYAQQNHEHWDLSDQIQNDHLDLQSELHTHGLEALSAAALYHPPEANMLSHPAPNDKTQLDSHFNSSPPQPQQKGLASSPTPTISTSNNINFLLNHPSSIDSPIDPSLMSPEINQNHSPSSGTVAASSNVQDSSSLGSAESEHKAVFLLRHFSESPGQWMDLFDLGTFFKSHVPVQALSHPLLKHAACAYSAKQLGRVKGAKAVAGGICSQQARMEIYDDPSVDWEWEGAFHYAKSIALLMDMMKQDSNDKLLETQDIMSSQWEALGSAHLSSPRSESRQLDRSTAQLRSDEVVSATAILSVYEFLSATGTAWSRHLNGTKSLLSMIPLEINPTFDSFFAPQHKFTRARKATFWNFARQDYQAAFINECQTRLDTEDLQLWREAGLLIDDEGQVIPSNRTSSGLPEGGLMKEDMISNALIWLSSRLCNYVAAGEGFHPIPAGDRSETPQEDGLGEIGRSQKSLLETWKVLQHALNVWHDGLPATFRPSARLRSDIRRPFSDIVESRTDCPFDEIWYSVPMCAATMMHYHMARILLLVNKPHETTARRSTLGKRLESYRQIEEETVFHCYEICGIASSRPEASIRIHATQPLFVAGQCLTHDRERRTILDLLRAIETDLGWATEYRVQQLLKDWDWVSDAEPAKT